MARLGERAKSARRIAEARIRTLERLSTESGADISGEFLDMARQLEKLSSQTRAPHRGKLSQSERAEIEQAISSIERARTQVSARFSQSLARAAREDELFRSRFIHARDEISNEAFISNVRLASKGIDIEGMDEVEIRAFFRATQSEWQNASVEDRYEAIIRAYETSDKTYTLSELFEAFKKQNKDVLEVMKILQSGGGIGGLTEEQKELFQKMVSRDDEQDKRYRKDSSVYKGTIALADLQAPDMNKYENDTDSSHHDD